MKLNAILLRWYRSFNITALGPGSQPPTERWQQYRKENFPFVRVPIDGRITSIVGANESGKSHLLSALSKVFNAQGAPGASVDKYEIKDVCRYSGFSPLEGLWADIGVELAVTPTEALLFEPDPADENAPTQSSVSESELQLLTVVLNGGKGAEFATVYKDNTVQRTFDEEAWFDCRRASTDGGLSRCTISTSKRSAYRRTAGPVCGQEARPCRRAALGSKPMAGA